MFTHLPTFSDPKRREFLESKPEDDVLPSRQPKGLKHTANPPKALSA